MTKVKCFIREESAAQPGKWIIRPVYENFHLNSTEGSFNPVESREAPPTSSFPGLSEPP